MSAIQFLDGSFEIDASFLGRGLDLAPSRIPDLLRSGAITSRCERGIGDDEGRYRITFFHEGRRLRIVIDHDGSILQLSSIDFGTERLPSALRRVG